jgi:hypothetical protein
MTVGAALTIPEPPKQQKQWTHPVQTLLPRTGNAQAAQETLNACFESMHEAEQKLNAACYFKKELYDDKAWQERNGVSIEDCFEVMFLTCLHVCTHAVIYEIWWGFRETS